MHLKRIYEDSIYSNISAVNKKQKVKIQELQIQIESQKKKYGQDPSCINFDLMITKRVTSAYGGNNKTRAA